VVSIKTDTKMSSSKTYGYYIAPPIVNQLLKAKKIVHKYDADRVYIVTGRERRGKSTLAMQLAYIVDPNLSLDNIAFSPREFEERIREADTHSAIIYDEAYLGMSASGSQSKLNVYMKKILQECGQRNLFIFIVLPSFFLLEKYPAIFRSDALFNVLVSKKNYNRRHYKVYNYHLKRILYLKGKPLMNMHAVINEFSYRFFSKLPSTIDKEAYKAKKKRAFDENKELYNIDGTRHNKALEQRNKLIRYLMDKYKINQGAISKIIGVSQSGISKSLSIS